MAPLPAQPLRVLVIDDDPVMRELLEALLGVEGYTVEAEESGEAGLRRMREGLHADVVLADVQLPGLSGPALGAELRHAVPDVRLLGMSGSQPAAEMLAAFDAFLLKPFSMEDFASAVANAQGGGGGGGASGYGKQAHGPAPLDETTYGRLATALSPAQLAELYQLTVTDVSARLGRMADALAGGELTVYRQEAHALKGGCSMVGALELAGLAARAETAEAGLLGDTPEMTEFLAAAERLGSTLAARFLQNG